MSKQNLGLCSILLFSSLIIKCWILILLSFITCTWNVSFGKVFIISFFIACFLNMFGKGSDVSDCGTWVWRSEFCVQLHHESSYRSRSLLIFVTFLLQIWSGIIEECLLPFPVLVKINRNDVKEPVICLHHSLVSELFNIFHNK